MHEAAPDERVGVLTQHDPDEEWIHDERDHRHAAEEDGDEAGVGGEGGEAGGGDGGGNKAEDTVGCDADDDADDVVDDAGSVVEGDFAGVAGVAQGDTAEDGPGEDADVVALHDGVHRVIGHFEEQRGEHGFKVFRCGGGVFGVLQVEFGREESACKNGDGSGGKGADDVETDDAFQAARLPLAVAGNGMGDEDEDEDGGDGAQGFGEEFAEDLEVFGGGDDVAAIGLRRPGLHEDAADDDAEQHGDDDLANEAAPEPAENVTHD